MSEWGVTLEPGLQGLGDEARFGPDAREKGVVFLSGETRWPGVEAWGGGGGGGEGKGRKKPKTLMGCTKSRVKREIRRPRLSACLGLELFLRAVQSL